MSCLCLQLWLIMMICWWCVLKSLSNKELQPRRKVHRTATIHLHQSASVFYIAPGFYWLQLCKNVSGTLLHTYNENDFYIRSLHTYPSFIFHVFFCLCTLRLQFDVVSELRNATCGGRAQPSFPLFLHTDSTGLWLRPTWMLDCCCPRNGMSHLDEI